MSGATQTDISNFVANLSPYAAEAGNTLGVNPSLILAQWGLESGYGTSSAATTGNNYGGLGPGLTYSSTQAFEQAYVQTIQNNYSSAENAGSNLSDFALGLYGAGAGASNAQIKAAGNSTNGYSTSDTGTAYETKLGSALSVIYQYINGNNGSAGNALTSLLSGSGSNGTSSTSGTSNAGSGTGSSSTSCTWYNWFLNWNCMKSIASNYVLIVIAFLLVIGVFITLLMDNKQVQNVVKTAGKAAFI